MRRNRTIIVGIGAGCTLLLSFGVLATLLYGISSKKDSIEESARARAAAEERREQLASLETLVADTASERERLASFVLTDETVIDFLSAMERTARATGLTIETRSLDVESIQNDAVFESLALSIEITGSQSAVSSMVSLIEQLPFQVTIRRLSLERAPASEGGTQRWRALFDIRVTKYKTR